MAIPNFNLMWEQFPDHARYPDLVTLFSFIGGQLAKNINVPGFGPNGNTCAVRMSRAFNYGEMPISAKTVKLLHLNPLVGDDKRLYLFRVSEMRTYIAKSVGAAPITVTKNFDTAFGASVGSWPSPWRAGATQADTWRFGMAPSFWSPSMTTFGGSEMIPPRPGMSRTPRG